MNGRSKKERFRRLVSYAWNFKKYLIGGLFLLFLAVGFDLVGPFIVRHLFDRELPSIVNGGVSAPLWQWITLYLVVNFLSSLTRYYSIIQLKNTANSVVQKMRNDIYSNLQQLPISFFDQMPAGKIVSRITNDTEAIQNLYALVLSEFITGAVYLIAIYATLFRVEARFAAVCLLLLPIFYAIIRFYRSKASIYNDIIRRKIGEINAMLNESIQGMRMIQVFGRQQKIEAEFDEINEENYRQERKLLILESTLSHNGIGVFKTLIFVWMIYHFGTKSMESSASVTVGTIYIFVEYITKIFNQVNRIMDRLGNLERSVVAADHVFDLLDETGEEFSAGGTMKVSGQVEFEKVCFAYQEDHYVLRDVSFCVEPGQTVGLVGHTGSGKSSVMNLLLRFYDPQEGKIRIDGKDIREIGRQALRKQIGIVLQDPYLFTGSIDSNIRLNDENISKQQAVDALQTVGGEQILRSLKDGIDEKVIEKGSTLSSGQRQLISFARALAHDPAILILDEATASIDSETEQMIQRAMEVLKKGRTTFVIAHRLSTIRHADQILVLHKGQIVERGRHEDLIAAKGRYYNMYQLQSASRKKDGVAV